MMIIGNSFLFGFCQIYSVNIPLYILLYSQILFYFPVLFFIFDAIKPLRIHKYRKRQEDARHIVMTILIIIAVVVVIFIAIYNSLVRKRNETENAFAAIDVMLKKRYDLIPNLVTTVKEYAEHEKSTFAQITEMRNKSYASFSNQDKENLDSAFSQACTHFFAIAENYPQLKASETEEQLSAARRTFNACVTDYNNAVQTFPSNLLAGMFGFTRKSVFSISEQERTVPNVNNLLNQ